MNFDVNIEINLLKLQVYSFEFLDCDAILIRLKLLLLLNSLILFPEAAPLVNLGYNSGVADLIERGAYKLLLNNVPGRKKLYRTRRFFLVWEEILEAKHGFEFRDELSD